MTTTLEALKALPRYGCGESDPEFRPMANGNWINRDDAIAALQAEQGQEPYAYLDVGCGAFYLSHRSIPKHVLANNVIEPLFRHAQPTPPAEQWVSVKERLPEPGEHVWAYIPDAGFVKIRECLFNGKHFNSPYHDVTHWMTLKIPKPPIDSTDAGDKTASFNL